MKKLAYLIAALTFAALFAACSKTEMTPEQPAISFNISVADLNPESRAVKTGWEEGDVLYLWIAPLSQEKPDLTLTYDGKTWNAGTLRQGCVLGEKGTFNVMYSGKNAIPSYAASFENGKIVYKNQSDYNSNEYVDGNTSYRVVGADIQVYCTAVSYTVKDDVFTASIDGWTFLTDFQVTLTDIPNGEYALQCSAKSSQNSAYVVARDGFQMTDKSVSVNGQDAAYFASATASSGSVVFYFARVNSSAINSDVTFTLIPKKSGSYTLSRALSYSTGEKTLKAAGSLQAVKIPYTKFMRTPDAVDMGLSVQWSTFNLGATIPGEYGYQYAYGETEPRDEYYWTTYSLCLEAYDKMIKYCPKDKEKYWGGYDDPDGKTVLDLSDDVANVKLGGKWRMPTASEWKELIDKCSWMWDTQYGLNGYTVTSKSTGNSIFLPAVGYQHSTTPSGIGSYGYYWSSSLDTEAPYNAWYLYFNAERRNLLTDSGYRYLGFSVRPVLGK